MKHLCIALLLALAIPAFAEKHNDIIRSDKPVTWLGLDFALARFIGPATQFGAAGEVTLGELRDKYMPGWNALFVNEPKKYDVAKWVKRDAVSFALDISAADNEAVGKAVFSQDPADLARLREADIAAQVGRMDFMGKTGIGYVIFIEGMNKGREEASGWITFVDMGTKMVLHTHRATGSPRGFGFRNYWAHAFLDLLQDTRSRD